MTEEENLGMLVEKADSVAIGETGKPLSLQQRYLLQFWVFKLQQQIEERLRQDKPLERFKEKVKKFYKTYFPHSKQPDDKLMDFLYEKTVDAAVRYKHAEECEIESGRFGWKKHRRWTKAVTELLERLDDQLKAADPERVSSTVQAEIEKALPQLDRLGVAVGEMARFDGRLENTLREVGDCDGRLDDRREGFAKPSNKNAVLTETQTSLRRTLANYQSHLSPDERGALIGMAMQAIGLGQLRKNQGKSIETIARNLRRHDKRLKGKKKTPQNERISN